MKHIILSLSFAAFVLMGSPVYAEDKPAAECGKTECAAKTCDKCKDGECKCGKKEWKKGGKKGHKKGGKKGEKKAE